LCRDFYNSVNPKGPTSISKRDRDPFSELQIDRAAHHKKICQWLMNPSRFSQEIKNEQLKFPGKCIYHLISTHPTELCNVKKECDKLISAKKTGSANLNSAQSGGTTGQLRHITEEVFEDAIDSDTKDECVEDNDTNDSDLLYFARVSNHYLRLV
jgi:hypothetical protein